MLSPLYSKKRYATAFESVSQGLVEFDKIGVRGPAIRTPLRWNETYRVRGKAPAVHVKGRRYSTDKLIFRRCAKKRANNLKVGL
jgi:hypothetical protein